MRKIIDFIKTHKWLKITLVMVNLFVWLFAIFSATALAVGINAANNYQQQQEVVKDNHKVKNAYVDTYQWGLSNVNDYFANANFMDIYNYFDRLSKDMGFTNLESSNAYIDANYYGSFFIRKVVNVGDIDYSRLENTPNDLVPGLVNFYNNNGFDCYAYFEPGSLPIFNFVVSCQNSSTEWSYLLLSYVLRYYSDSYQIVQSGVIAGVLTYNPRLNYNTFVNYISTNRAFNTTQYQRWAFIIPRSVTSELDNDAFYLFVAQSLDTKYELGYNAGFQSGYQNGYNVGYEVGSTGLTSNPFNLISNAFSSLASILNIQVLPNLTLGVLIFVPVIFGIIVVLFRMIKG